MSKLESLFRQIEIIKVAKKGTFTWEELSNHLDRKSEELEYNLSISRRTLARDLREIEQLFGLSIPYDFKSGSYQLHEKDSWESNIELLESFETIQAFGSRKSLRGKVFFEKRLARGTTYLKSILDAIQAKEALQIVYQKYWEAESNIRTILPIALKEYKHRWYVIAWNEHKYLRNYGLDRIKSLDRIPGQQLFPEAPDLAKRFDEVIGIINSADEDIETVVLTFTEFKGRYIQSMPWHSSQTTLVDDGKILTISLQVKINYELISDILSHGDEVRVDAPERLREMVLEKVRNMGNGNLK